LSTKEENEMPLLVLFYLYKKKNRGKKEKIRREIEARGVRES
jgi:hypothetical protein